MPLNYLRDIAGRAGKKLLKIVRNTIYGKNSDEKKRSLFISKYVEYDPSSNLNYLKLEVWQPCEKKFLKVGKDSVITGTFVFENQNGFLSIGDRCFTGNSNFRCIDGIEIGNDVMISWGCTFVDHNSHSINSQERIHDVPDWKRGMDENKIGYYKNWNTVKHGKIIIKDKAWIGFNSIIVKGVTIGEGAVVGAGSVVIKDVPPYTLVMGNPAKVVWKTK